METKCTFCGGEFSHAFTCVYWTPRPATAEPPEWKDRPQLIFNRIMNASVEAARQAKENWIERYIFVSGQQWGDTPPTREEAEKAWAERQPVLARTTPDFDWSSDEDQAVVRIDPEQVKGWVGTPGSTDPDPIAEFNERRKAKRFLNMPSTEAPIPRCTHCKFRAPTWEASMDHAGPCGEKHRSLARAMSLDPNPTFAEKLRPYRGRKL